MPEPPGPPPSVVVTGLPKPTIVNGLLCCIMRALSRNPSRSELVAVITRDSSEPLIKEAWTLLFSCFSDAEDKIQKKRIIDIARESTAKMVEDMIIQLDHIGRNAPDVVSFLMPQDYTIKEFESESEYRGRIWEQEKGNEGYLRFQDLENKIEKKHQDLVYHLEKWSSSIVNLVTNGQGQIYTPEQLAYAMGGHGQPFTAQGSLAPHVNTYANVLSGQNGRVESFNSSNVIPSTIHHGRGQQSARLEVTAGRRNEDGSYSDVGVNQKPHEHRQNSANGQQRSKKSTMKAKSITGTSDSNATGRKMVSSPADIFIWGVHPSTTVEDIVNDLTDSGITVEANNIEKKSKPEAYLCSYKISIPSAQLDKALDPSIWPLRVKVREYIHYSNKPKKQRNSNSSDVQAESGITETQVQGDSAADMVVDGNAVQTPGPTPDEVIVPTLNCAGAINVTPLNLQHWSPLQVPCV